MKNILIPTDFNTASLACVEHVTRKFGNEPLNILLVHVFSISDSLIDLLKLSQRNKDYEHISKEFWAQCNRLEKEYTPQIKSIRVKCFYGSTVAVFKNFLEANHIDMVVYPENYSFKKLSKTSLDPSKLIARCGKEVVRINPKQEELAYENLEWLKSVYLSAVN